MNFKKYLTAEERAECIKAGFLMKLASCGKKPSDVGMTKTALDPVGFTTSAFGDIGAAILAISIAAGLPVGAVLHWADKSMTSDRKKTKELQKQRDTYLDAMAQLKNHMNASGSVQ